MHVELAEVSSLRPHPRNYRKHPKDQLEHLAASLKEHGFYRAIVVAEDDTVLAGHGILAAAKRVGIEYAPIVRLAIAPDDPRALKVLAGDNEVGKLAEVDDRALSELLKEIAGVDSLVGTGYDGMMLANLVMVTRPASEIADFNAALEWVGLPVYDEAPTEAPPVSLKIAFPTEADRERFVEESGVQVTKGKDGAALWSARWPHAPKRDVGSIRIVAEGDDENPPIAPRYPVYVISKGRYDRCLTARFLVEDGVDFRLVVEPQEFDLYAARFGAERILVLPFSNLGLGGIPARNWVWEHAKAEGHARHWILDDNIRYMNRRVRAQKVRCQSGPAFAAVEDFVDRYQNIAIGGLQYAMFVPDGQKLAPFTVNHHVYSCLLIQNNLPHRWRGRYNEDTDLCLQVLADGYCTVLVNAFNVEKVATMKMKGGNSDQLYQGDGRLKMARSLERVWPGVVETKRRFGRPQHKVADEWGKFDTKLLRKRGLVIDPTPNEYGMSVRKLAEIESPSVRKLYEELLEMFGQVEDDLIVTG